MNSLVIAACGLVRDPAGIDGPAPQLAAAQAAGRPYTGVNPVDEVLEALKIIDVDLEDAAKCLGEMTAPVYGEVVRVLGSGAVVADSDAKVVADCPAS
ncbi:hypothetical protein [Micromonospora sp. NPDC000018]|uniref:hypothetical protein n=1 Tax=Micromonospora sp. NPDC000018 TaxID=3154239 RepID=UPI00331A1619